MHNSRTAWLVFKRILIILFILFLINYYQVESGNYQSELSKKTILTEEKIREFEDDVRNGEYVDIKDYTESNYVDTSNNVSKAGNKVGNAIDKLVNEKAPNFFKILKKYFF